MKPKPHATSLVIENTEATIKTAARRRRVLRLPLERAERLVLEAMDRPESHSGFTVRLMSIIEATGSVLALAQRAGVSDSSIHFWIEGGEPSREKLVALSRAADVRLEWLLTGQGPMRSGGTLPEGYALVPGYPARSGRALKGVDYLALKTSWIASLPGSPSPQALLLTEMIGDAMEPTIYDGDLILVNTGDREMTDGVFLFNPITGDRPTPVVRRVQLSGRTRVPLLLCDNPKYKRSERGSGLGIMGRVIWRGGLI